MAMCISCDRIGAYRNFERMSRRSGWHQRPECKTVGGAPQAGARDRRESWTTLLIGRDFSGLTLTADKP
jgi:hypothetical protein